MARLAFALLLGIFATIIDPVPESLIRASRETLTWRRVDAELAELLSDSAVEDERLALVRGDGEPRSLSFEAGGVGVTTGGCWLWPLAPVLSCA